MVLYQFTVPGHVYRKLRIESWSVKSLGRKKGSRLRLCFRVVEDVPEKKGMDFWKQMSSSKCSFICGIFLPLNPSTTTVYARSTFYPSLRFTLSLQSAFYTVCILPMVRSPQSSFYTDRFESESFCNCWERRQGWTAAQSNRRKQGASAGIQISSPGSCRFPIWLPYRKTRKPWGRCC